MNIKSAFPSRYVKAADIPEGETIRVVITGVKIENVAGQGAERDDKPVLSFKGTEKTLALNKTNANTIAKALGSDDTDDWIGKSILLYATETEFRGEMVACIRIRADKTGKPVPRAANGAAPSIGGASRPAARPSMQMANADEPEGGHGAEGPEADDDTCPF